MPLNTLLSSFLQYAGKYRFWHEGSKVLAAVSGGIDSMVMLHLLYAAGVNCALAHCNFCLRGDESDGDEFFVREKAASMGIPLHVTRFDTTGYAAQNGLSIQMAARKLRYRWFEELAGKYSYDAIAIAHNRDDRIETLFINLARGTGIRGLTGIKPATGKLIRPLLFTSRENITTYALTHDIKFREDSSNTTDKYARNFIRHHVIPGLEQFFPGMQQTIERDIEHFSDVEAFFTESVERFTQHVVSIKDNLIYIDLQGLNASPSPRALLYEILRPLGFAGNTVSDILDNPNRSGQQFFSHTHRLLRNRQTLVVQVLERDRQKEFLIDKHSTEIQTPVRLNISYFDKGMGFKPDTGRNIACLDCEKLQFPLLLRKWKHGDVFRPLGMKNMKKLSDFFTDHKLSIIEKEQCWILVSGDHIVWIAGLRIDDRFKITDETKRVTRIEYLKNPANIR